VIEILDHLDILTDPALDLATVTLAGIPLGAPAEAIDRGAVRDVSMTNLTRSYRGGPEPEHYDWDGNRIPMDVLINDVIENHGVLHLPGQLAFKVIAGRVVALAVHGGQPGDHLAHFKPTVRTYDEFVAVFGTPDQAEESWSVGELMGVWHRWGKWKSIYWDSWDNELSTVSLGDQSWPHLPDESP
jgi:hypothetical protein